MSFNTRLKENIQLRKSQLCVGLDPDIRLIPDRYKVDKKPLFTFNKDIIDATAKHACVFKPQFAHYAALGKENELEESILYIRNNHPELIIILDAKRGDIGNTATYYAEEAFKRYQAHAVTILPYMGSDSITPFTSHPDKGVFVVCRTSNPSAGLIQDKVFVDPANANQSITLAGFVARMVTTELNQSDNCGLVLGATDPDAFGETIKYCPGLPILVPGIGAQGGDLTSIISRAGTAAKDLIFNSSRGIIHATSDSSAINLAEDRARSLRDEINASIQASSSASKPN